MLTTTRKRVRRTRVSIGRASIAERWSSVTELPLGDWERIPTAERWAIERQILDGTYGIRQPQEVV